MSEFKLCKCGGRPEEPWPGFLRCSNSKCPLGKKTYRIPIDEWNRGYPFTTQQCPACTAKDERIKELENALRLTQRDCQQICANCHAERALQGLDLPKLR